METSTHYQINNYNQKAKCNLNSYLSRIEIDGTSKKLKNFLSNRVVENVSQNRYLLSIINCGESIKNFDIDGNVAATLHKRGRVKLWNLEQKKLIKEITISPFFNIFNIKIVKNKLILITAIGAKIFNLETENEISYLIGFTKIVGEKLYSFKNYLFFNQFDLKDDLETSVNFQLETNKSTFRTSQLFINNIHINENYLVMFPANDRTLNIIDLETKKIHLPIFDFNELELECLHLDGHFLYMVLTKNSQREEYSIYVYDIETEKINLLFSKKYNSALPECFYSMHCVNEGKIWLELCKELLIWDREKNTSEIIKQNMDHENDRFPEDLNTPDRLFIHGFNDDRKIMMVEKEKYFTETTLTLTDSNSVRVLTKIKFDYSVELFPIFKDGCLIFKNRNKLVSVNYNLY